MLRYFVVCEYEGAFSTFIFEVPEGSSKRVVELCAKGQLYVHEWSQVAHAIGSLNPQGDITLLYQYHTYGDECEVVPEMWEPTLSSVFG